MDELDKQLLERLDAWRVAKVALDQAQEEYSTAVRVMREADDKLMETAKALEERDHTP